MIVFANSGLKQNTALLSYVCEYVTRVEICHDRRDRRSCKICASCVNFSRKQRVFLHNFCKSTPKCDFTVEILHIELNLNKNLLNLLILIHLRCFNLSILVIIYTLLVCKTFGPKIRSCKFFDKSQVCLEISVVDHGTSM